MSEVDPMTTDREPAVRLLPVRRAGTLVGGAEFARRCGVHPELLARLVRLGLVAASRDPAGALVFHPDELATVARIQRLRTGLSLNYTAVGVVLDLLDRIRVLELALRRQRGATVHIPHDPGSDVNRSDGGGTATWI
jgi:chaperone modulatory protein CbpM